MPKTVKGKKAGIGLEMKTFKGTKGNYIVFKLPTGAFHTFVETEAKSAAKDCGSTRTDTNTREYWRELWNKN